MNQENNTTTIVPSKYGKFIALLIGLILVGVGIFTYFKSGDLVRVCTEKATAKVVNMREEFDTSSNAAEARYLYYPIIEYQADGATVRSEIATGSNPPAYSINDTVDILYNPAKTSEFIIAGENQNIAWIILGGLGIIFIGVGVFLFIKK